MIVKEIFYFQIWKNSCQFLLLLLLLLYYEENEFENAILDPICTFSKARTRYFSFET